MTPMLKERKMNTHVRLCSILATCIFMGGAFAAERVAPADRNADRVDPVTLKFRFDPRDLETQEGAERVHRRLVIAARRQCSYSDLLIELRGVDKQCVSDLVDKAVRQTGSVQLAEVHRGMERADLAARR
jgi:UrcA family protein